jgi:RES domain-containing protein
MSETLIVYRLCRKEYAKGLIASGFANRWNSKGQKVIYCASSRSLASLELLVHMSRIIPGEPYVMVAISIHKPALMITDTPLRSLPENWRSMGALGTLQKSGSLWYDRQTSLALRVPSIVIPEEYNYMINTEHPKFQTHISILHQEDHFWDKRLFAK